LARAEVLSAPSVNAAIPTICSDFQRRFMLLVSPLGAPGRQLKIEQRVCHNRIRDDFFVVSLADLRDIGQVALVCLRNRSLRLGRCLRSDRLCTRAHPRTQPRGALLPESWLSTRRWLLEQLLADFFRVGPASSASAPRLGAGIFGGVFGGPRRVVPYLGTTRRRSSSR
jgi:hypothetical protein